MSQKEFQRVKVIENTVDGRMSVSEAAGLLQLSERQVQRLKRRYRPDSVPWVAGKQPVRWLVPEPAPIDAWRIEQLDVRLWHRGSSVGCGGRETLPHQSDARPPPG
jgi:transposase